MKIIDLLNKIAKGEENDLQTEFVFDGEVYNFYKFKNESDYCLDGWLLNQEIKIINSLNDEVEIIEENKIPEKILKDEFNDLTKEGKLLVLFYKFNEIIDYLKSKGE